MKTALIEGQAALFDSSFADISASHNALTSENADYREIANHLLVSLGQLAAANRAQGFLQATEMPKVGQSLRQRYGQRFEAIYAAKLQARAKSSRAARDAFYTAMGEDAPTVLEPGDPDVQLLWLNFRREYGQTGWEGIRARRLSQSLIQSTVYLEV